MQKNHTEVPSPPSAALNERSSPAPCRQGQVDRAWAAWVSRTWGKQGAKWEGGRGIPLHAFGKVKVEKAASCDYPLKHTGGLPPLLLSES